MTNTSAPVYAKINGTKVVYNGGAAGTAFPVWRQWNIDLASVAGLNLKSIKTLAIGVGDGTAGGTGTIFIDDIRLYAAPPQIVTPADPGNSGLVVLYAMEGDLKDTSGKNNNGTASGEPALVDGQLGFGKALSFDGTNDYVDLPIGTLVSTMTSGTFAAWVNYANTGNAWQRVFDFGTGPLVYMYLAAESGATNAARFAITLNGYAAGAESAVDGTGALGDGWHHLAVVIDAAGMTLKLYQDGTLVDSGATRTLPRELGVTTQNWLGRSQFTPNPDPFFAGMLDDFRIYNRALSDSEVRYLAGDR